MREHAAYLIADPSFFESIGQLTITPSFQDLARQALPESWNLERSEIWMMATFPGMAMPPQGFKIHLSTTPENACEMLRIVIPLCVTLGIPFKFAASPEILSIIVSKTMAGALPANF